MADSVTEASRRRRGGQPADESRIDRQIDGYRCNEDENRERIYVKIATTESSGARQGNSSKQREGKERRGLPAAGFRLRC